MSFQLEQKVCLYLLIFLKKLLQAEDHLTFHFWMQGVK